MSLSLFRKRQIKTVSTNIVAEHAKSMSNARTRLRPCLNMLVSKIFSCAMLWRKLSDFIYGSLSYLQNYHQS